jgi:hypothetical protein
MIMQQQVMVMSWRMMSGRLLARLVGVGSRWKPVTRPMMQRDARTTADGTNIAVT